MRRRDFLRAVPLAAASACSRQHFADGEVTFAVWDGDEDRNRYFRGSVADDIRRHLGFRLRVVNFPGTAQYIDLLIAEKQTGRASGSSADVVWINGENFRAARQAGVLWGPFANTLANLGVYPPAALLDFGTATDGFEAPWQKAQFVFAWDPARTALSPGLDLDGLWAWLEQHPGRFTYAAPPDFTGSAFIRHVLLEYGDRRRFASFDPAFYDEVASAALRRLRDIRRLLWRRGEAYPATARELDRLFATNEVDLSMNYNPDFASLRIARGEFPVTARTFVLATGTLAHYSYLAIPFNAPNKEGARMVIDYLLSFDAQLALSRALRSPFPIDISTLDTAHRTLVNALPRGPATLADEWLAAHSVPEPHPEYLLRFERDWQSEIRPA